MELQTNPHNPRTISKDAYEKLKRSIERNPDGLTANKIAYKDGIIISGNQRYRAILELGLTIKPEWLKDLSGWTQEQIDEWVIQSNISAGEWDWDILANEWEQTDLEEWGVDTSQEWDNKKELPEDIDDIPEVKTPVSKLGDLWLLDGHRVLCGDSTDKTTVERLMDGKKADITFTSPPYNADANSHLTGEVKGFDKKYKAGGDDLTPEDYLLLLTESTELAIQHSRYSFFNLQLLAHNRQTIIEYQYKMKSYLKDILIWNKQIAPPNIVKGAFNTKWEYVFCFSEDNKTRGFPCKWQGQHFNVIETESNSGNKYAKDHKAGFPVAFPTWIIEKMDFAKSVYDPFIGTGTTLIASEQLNRQCYGMELDPSYVDVICKRWQTLTGQMPILESTGETHDFSS